jgi:hypothetical protein
MVQKEMAPKAIALDLEKNKKLDTNQLCDFTANWSEVLLWLKMMTFSPYDVKAITLPDEKKGARFLSNSIENRTFTSPFVFTVLTPRFSAINRCQSFQLKEVKSSF